MNIVRRLKRLEAIGGTPRTEDPLFYVRVNAMRNLAPSDWRAVSAMARRSYITGRAISDGDAVSKNSVNASIRFARDSSIDSPSLAISSSGHNATYPSSSRSIIAVNRCGEFMVRIYTDRLGAQWQLNLRVDYRGRAEQNLPLPRTTS